MKPQVEVEALRRVSKSAFGHTHRLELMLAIADIEDGVCTLSDLADRLGVRPSSIQRPFESLVELSLVSALPAADTKFRHYIRNDGPAWDWARALADGVELAGTV